MKKACRSAGEDSTDREALIFNDSARARAICSSSDSIGSPEGWTGRVSLADISRTRLRIASSSSARSGDTGSGGVEGSGMGSGEVRYEPL